MQPLCVLGLGLIGGSLLRAATAAGRTAWGATVDEAEIAAAAADGFDVPPTVADALRRAADADALIVLAVPLTSLDDVLRQIAEYAPACRLTDMVSVKGAVLEAVGRRLPRARYVGGHPMAGAAASGWSAGGAELFRDAAWVVTTDAVTVVGGADDSADDSGGEDSGAITGARDATAGRVRAGGLDAGGEGESDAGRWDGALWAEVARLAIDCGAQVVPATSAEHDSVTARISHLPHLLAAVLASVGADGGPLALALAAGSFGDGTRVAGSRPELVRAMCEGNRDALMDALDDALGRLGAARGSLASTGSLAKTIEAGHHARQELQRRRSDAGSGSTVRIDLAGPSARDSLLALGRAGGRITELAGTVAVGSVSP